MTTLGSEYREFVAARSSTALVVLNPREIPECMTALRALRVPKCWVSYMYEPPAAKAINRAIEETSFDRYVVISDDTCPTQDALDRVLALHDRMPGACVTGYCNLDSSLPFVNLTWPWKQLAPPPPSVDSYALVMRSEIDNRLPHGAAFRSGFAGLALTCMSRELWLRFPLHHTSLGGQIDYQLSYELQQAGVEIHAPIGAFVQHVKEEWNKMDKNPEKRLLVGERPSSVTWTDLELKEAV